MRFCKNYECDFAEILAPISKVGLESWIEAMDVDSSSMVSETNHDSGVQNHNTASSPLGRRRRNKGRISCGLTEETRFPVKESRFSDKTTRSGSSPPMNLYSDCFVWETWIWVFFFFFNCSHSWILWILCV
jgi:hypothetical protein